MHIIHFRQPNDSVYLMNLLFYLGMKDTTDHILPSSSLVLTTEEEAERFVIDSLRSQKEFDGFNLNQVK